MGSPSKPPNQLAGLISSEYSLAPDAQADRVQGGRELRTLLHGPHVVQATLCQPTEQDGRCSEHGQLMAAARGADEASPEQQHEDVEASQLWQVTLHMVMVIRAHLYRVLAHDEVGPHLSRLSQPGAQTGVAGWGCGQSDCA